MRQRLGLATMPVVRKFIQHNESFERICLITLNVSISVTHISENYVVKNYKVRRLVPPSRRVSPEQLFFYFSV